MHEEHLNEEIFCLNFELKAFSDFAIRDHTERWVPGFCHPLVEADHSDRYHFASKLIINKNVLDLACGVGKGALIMATTGMPAQIVAGDINDDSIRYACQRHSHPLISFEKINCERFSFDYTFDVIVSFETIEHLNDVESFLKNVYKTLDNAGTFIVSTPISSVSYNHNPANIFHVQEWGFNKFHQVIKNGGFNIDEVYTQLYPPINKINNSLLSRVWRRIFPVINTSENIDYKSAIQLYNGSIPVSEIGIERTGYQILICSKSINE